MDKYEALRSVALECANITLEKNEAYGNSYGKIGAFLSLLYPDGVSQDQYGHMLTLTRIFDKIMRIATDKDAFRESPYKDIIGYCLLELQKEELHDERKGQTLGDAKSESSNADPSTVLHPAGRGRIVTIGFTKDNPKA